MNKRFLLTTAAVVALSTSAFAQSPSAPSSSAPSSSPSAAQQRPEAPSASGKADASGQSGSPQAGGASAPRAGSASHDASKDSSTAASRPSADAPRSDAPKSADGNDAVGGDAGKADTANDARRTGDRTGDKAEGRTGTSDSKTRDSASDGRARRGDDRQNAGQRPDRDHDRDSADRRDRDDDRNGRDRDTADRSSADVKGSVRIDDRQRTRISQSISRLDVRPLTSVNFSVSVGVVVPRGVELRPLPSEIVEIVPQYRGYDFVLVRDEIVIVEPSSHKIVTVLPYSGKTTASNASRARFSERDREVIRKHAKAAPAGRQTTTGSSVRTEIRMGERLPDDVEIEAFPEEVYREVPTLREYRYIDRGNRIYIVEPGDRRIIEEID